MKKILILFLFFLIGYQHLHSQSIKVDSVQKIMWNDLQNEYYYLNLKSLNAIRFDIGYFEFEFKKQKLEKLIYNQSVNDTILKFDLDIRKYKKYEEYLSKILKSHSCPASSIIIPVYYKNTETDINLKKQWDNLNSNFIINLFHSISILSVQKEIILLDVLYMFAYTAD